MVEVIKGVDCCQGEGVVFWCSGIDVIKMIEIGGVFWFVDNCEGYVFLNGLCFSVQVK